MLVLKTDCNLSPELMEIVRKEVKEHTGEDCIILTNGLTIERFPCAKDEAALKMKLTDMEEYVAGIDRITSALNRASEAKKEFDALLEKTPNSEIEMCIDGKSFAKKILGDYLHDRENQ